MTNTKTRTAKWLRSVPDVFQLPWKSEDFPIIWFASLNPHVPACEGAHGCGCQMQAPFEDSLGSEAAVWKSEVVGLGEPNRGDPPTFSPILKLAFEAANVWTTAPGPPENTKNRPPESAPNQIMRRAVFCNKFLTQTWFNKPQGSRFLVQHRHKNGLRNDLTSVKTKRYFKFRDPNIFQNESRNSSEINENLSRQWTNDTMKWQ